MLEDIEEIKQLKSTYMYCLDERDWDGLLDCFTEDCKIDYGPFGKFESKKELEKFFKEVYPPVNAFTMHVTHDPIIKVNGDKAKGKWYMQASATFAESNRAAWVAVQYNDELVREKGKWKCKSTSLTYIYYTPYEEGWAKTRMMVG